ncbi:MAG: DUF992 domain-containing protein [Xanthobacteraceae bacterium]|nr:DUF992 domain-containing protein [Xanthobacteraceae bacterium]MBX3549315.1 DUF992 domain-containing protein [Xanthobacteraceae bacterium]MCW5673605.1 DUF992 domain-containing protein [Xanthobacteraceae bacterium]
MSIRMRALASAFAVTALAATTAIATAQPQDRIQAGTLNCDVSAGLGLIIGSQKEVTCQFIPADNNSPREVYVGVINKFGLDIGATSKGQMVWNVFAPTSRPVAALSGDYVGAGAEATVAVGLGANVLVGGNNRTVALQPVSIQAQEGLNVAAGVTELKLRPVR